MNGKLLKVCAAVMLIVGAGDAVCQGPGSNGGATSGSAEARQDGWSDWGDSVSVNVTGKINAVVKVRCGDKSRDLVFYGDDGKKTSDEERKFPFQVRCLASGCNVKFKPTGGLKFSNGRWFINGGEKGKDVLPLSIVLEDPDGSKQDLKADTLDMTPKEETLPGDERTWQIFFDVDDISSKSPRGEFKGGLTIEILAA